MKLVVTLGLVVLWTVFPDVSTRREEPTGPAVAIELDGERRCGGALVSDRWILTARHCVHFPAAAGGAVEPGRLGVVTWRGERIAVESVALAGSSRRRGAGSRAADRGYEDLGDLRGSDLALVRLAAPMRDHPRLVLGSPQAGDSARGARLEGDQVRRVRIVKIDESEVYTSPVTCTGDSGSPLVGADGRLIGIASWRTALPCDRGLSVFTRVDARSEWLAAVLGAA